MKTANTVPRLIIFDWDGTLCDSIGLIVDCFTIAARRGGLPVPPPVEIRYTIGMDLPGAMQHLFGKLTEARTAEFVSEYRAYYLTRVEELALFPGARECLEYVRELGLQTAIATGKNRVGLDRMLKLTNSAHFFDFSRCSDEAAPKPAPAMVLDILSELQLPPEAALVIGDTTHDLRMATSAGSRALGVTYGAHSRDLLEAEAHLGLLHDIRELPEFLSELRQSSG